MKTRTILFNKLKTLYLIFLCISGFCLSSFSKSIDPTATKMIFDHMVEVNKEWLKQSNLPKELFQSIAFNNDIERIQLHLQLVEQILRNNTSKSLSKTQKANRLKHLKVLRLYLKKGLFPINLHHKERTPYFIDHLGIACAVGHLMNEDEQENLTSLIKQEFNNGYINELKIHYPAIEDWAKINGFTIDELAWIQPAYGSHNQSIIDAGEIDGAIYASAVDPITNEYIFAGNFTTVNGIQNLGSIIVYDGDQVSNLGTGVQGSIYALEFFNNTLYAGGDFYINGEISNLAYFDGNSWISIQTGAMEGVVKSLETYQCALVIGGSFTKVNGQDSNYITIWDGNSLGGSNCTTINKFALSTNGPVNELEVINNKLFVGGSFNFVGIGNFGGPSKYLAAFQDNNWTDFFNGDHHEVVSVTKVAPNNLLIACEKYNFGNDFATYNLDLKTWDYTPTIQNNYNLSGGIGSVGQVYNLEGAWASTDKGLVHLNTFTYYPTNGPVYTSNSQSSVILIADYQVVFGGLFNSLTNLGTVYSSSLFMLAENSFLPVELLSFSGILNNKAIQLKWETATESNTSHFEVERRNRFGDYETVGRVDATGESTFNINYQFEDDHLDLSQHKWYYRLKMVDFDETFEYSNEIVIQSKNQTLVEGIYPNPARDKINIALHLELNETHLDISLFDISGKKVHSLWNENMVNIGSINKSFDLPQIANGLYIIKIIAGDYVYHQKIQIFK